MRGDERPARDPGRGRLARLAAKMTALQSRVSALAFACFLAVPAFAENIVFPTSPTSPVINVKTVFGAAGDGVTDDTAADSFRITSLIATGGTATLAFTALADRSYTVQTNASLATNGWQKFTDVPASAERAVNVASPMNVPRRFHRVVTPATP